MTILCDRTGLHLPDKTIAIGSSEWIQWLEANKSFRFECPQTTQIQGGFTETNMAGFTGIKQGKYWQAHKKVRGQLRREYLGKPQELTYETLRETAYKICSNRYWESHQAEQKAKAESHNKQKCETVSELSLETAAEIEELNRQIRELKHRCIHLENENNRLTRLGQDYSHETVARLSEKYTKAIQDIQHWKESSESYKRQAAKLRAQLDELETDDEKPPEDKNAIANLKRQVKEERDRANEYCLDGLKAASILHEALKLKANSGGAIKAKIKKALELIDDI